MRDRFAWALAVLGVCASTAANAGSLAEDVMAAIKAQPARTATFVEEKRLSSLDMPLVSSGRLVFVPPAHLEKLTDAPRPERLVIDVNRISITGDGGERTLMLDESPELRALADTLRDVVSGDLADLRRLYDIDEQGGMSAWRLTLTPSLASLRRSLARVTLDGAGPLLRQIDIQQIGGDEQRLTVSPQ